MTITEDNLVTTREDLANGLENIIDNLQQFGYEDMASAGEYTNAVMAYHKFQKLGYRLEPDEPKNELKNEIDKLVSPIFNVADKYYFSEKEMPKFNIKYLKKLADKACKVLECF